MNTDAVNSINIKKQRYSNIELCRIVAILLVVMVHATYASLGFPKKMSDTTFFTLLSESLSIIGVNLFIIISGWFKIIPKKKSIINLLYICFFYGLVKLSVLYVSGNLVFNSFLFISKSNWFIPNYILLILLAPVLNTFIVNENKENYKKLLILLLVVQTWLGCFPGLCDSLKHGYSAFSFIILYLLSQYFHLYGYPKLLKKYSFTIYLLCSLFLTLVSFSILFIGRNVPWNSIYAYSNPIVILSSFSLFFTFQKIKIKDNIVINHIAKSCLAVLLLHANSVAFPYMKSFFTDNYSYDFWFTMLRGGTAILMIFTISVLIDQHRIYSYKFITQTINKSY